MQTRLDTFNNDWYNPGSPLKRALWYVVSSVLFETAFPVNRIKISILRIFGAQVGKGVVIKPRVRIKYPWLLKVGDFTWIGENVWIDNLAAVNIGAHCCLSQGAFLLCGNHDYSKSSFDLMIGPITLEDGAWLGAKAIICPNVTMGSHSVLSVGAVATKNLDANTIYAGQPAVAIRERKIVS